MRAPVSWQRNMVVGPVNLRFDLGLDSDFATLARWDIRDNLCWMGPAAVQRARSFGVDTLVEEPKSLSLDPHDHRNYMRVSNPSVVLNRDGRQEYIGALPPGPAPPEGDWFTRLLQRWEEVQQRIEKLSADDAGGGQEPASGSPRTARPAAKPLPVRPRP